MNPETVVIVTDALHVDGGSGKVALSSAAALATTGRRVIVFGAIGPIDPALAATPGIEIVCTEQPHIAEAGARALARGIWNVRARRMMLECLAALDPARTVVHVHGWTKALSASVVHAAVEAGFSVAVTLHEYFTACPTGSLFLHDEQRICTIRPMSGACIARDCDSRSYAHKLWRVARQLVQAHVARIPASITDYITVSDFSRDILAPMLPPDAVFHGVPNPVEATPGPRVAAENNASFVYVGRLSPEKGAVHFARAARLAGVPARFVGDGTERDAVLAANPDAEIAGWLSPSDTIAALRDARVLVLPSLWYETLGLAVLEAAALGVPAIVPANSAARDSVRNGITGLTFAGGNVDDLAAKMRALRDDALIAHMSRAAHASYWDEPFTMRRHVAGLLETYRAVLSARPATAAASARDALASDGAA